MIFSSLQYLIFLPIVVLLYWRTSGGARLTLVVLASYFFYMSWFPVYGALLLFLTVANWTLGLALAAPEARNADEQSASHGGAELQKQKHGPLAMRGDRPTPTFKRKAILTVGLILNLGCLCFFKYTNFILQNVFQLLNLAQLHWANLTGHIGQVAPWEVPILSVILPLGISFFVFEFVHYVVDVYYGSRPVKSFMEFAAFASFFPSQIAGPIKRYQDFQARLRSPQPWSKDLFFEAMTLLIQGLVKKVAIADPLGMLVASSFASHNAISAADALLAAVGFYIQVYCDFSGYTDMGRGSALLLGVRLPENFNLPYLSEDLADFWRRWHMSLGTWLRDYVYIPLGGSKAGRVANWRNLFLTMVACGLWHGANWHYVLFGAAQGIGLVVNREWKTFLKTAKPLRRACESIPGRLVSTALTVMFIVITYVIFRAPDLPRAWNVLHSLVNFGGTCTMWPYLIRSCTLQLLAVYTGFWLVSELAKRKPLWFGPLVDLQQSVALRFDTPVRLASWTAAIILTIAARPTDAIPFVYFQF